MLLAMIHQRVVDPGVSLRKKVTGPKVVPLTGAISLVVP